VSREPQQPARRGLVRAFVRWFVVRLGRRLLGVALVLLVLAVALFGDGLGWFPGSRGPQPDPAVPPREPLDDRREARPADAPPSPPAPGPGEGAAQADQRSTLWSVVRTAPASGTLADGFDAVRRLRAMNLPAGEREDLVRAEAGLELALVRELAHLREQLRLGSVHAARAVLVSLLAAGDPDVRRIVREDSVRSGIPDLGAATLPAWPEVVPAPLARGRAVVVVRDGASSRTVVADAQPDAVTVRLQGPDGVSWPLVSVTRLELPDPLAAEALALAHAARRAGDGTLARLWLACCVQLPGGADLGRGLLQR